MVDIATVKHVGVFGRKGSLTIMDAADDEKLPQQIQNQKAMAEGNLKIIQILEFRAEVMCFNFNEVGNFLAVGLASGDIKVFSMETWQHIYSLNDIKIPSLPVTAIKWKKGQHSPSDAYTLIATYASGRVCQWHVTSKTFTPIYKDPSQMICAAFANSGKHYAVGSSDGKIHMFSSESKQRINVLEPSTNTDVLDGHQMRVFALRFNPVDENVLLSGGWDDTIQFWDMRVSGRHSFRWISGPHICGDALDIEPETQIIVSGSWRKKDTLQIWDYGSGNLIDTLPPDYNPSMLYSVQWKNRDTVICGGTNVNMMRLINVSSRQTTGRLVDLSAAVYAVDSNGQSEKPLIAAGSKRNVYLLRET